MKKQISWVGCVCWWVAYPKLGRALLLGAVAAVFGIDCMLGAVSANAAPPPSALHEQILRARKAALHIRKHEKQLWDIERRLAHAAEYQKAVEKKIAKETDKKIIEGLQQSLRSFLENAKQDQKRAEQTRRYLRYVESREPLVGKQRWRGHLYIHPTRGLLREKVEGAELIVSLDAWRAHCAKKVPHAYPPPKEGALRSLVWGKSKWWMKEIQGARQLAPMHPERRYFYMSSASQFNLCHPAPFFLWDMQKKMLVKLPAPPLAEMFTRYPALLPWLQAPMPRSPLHGSFRLLSFDAASQTAFLLFSRSRYSPRTIQQKAFLLRWDLAAQQIRQVIPLPHHTCHGKAFLDLKRQLFFSLEAAYTEPERCFWHVEGVLSIPQYKTALMAFHWPTGQLRTQAEVFHEHTLHDFRFDRRFTKWLVVEYHVRWQRPVSAFVYDLRTGKRVAHPIGAFNYGLAFSANEQHVFVGNADKGFVYRFLVDSTKKARKTKIGQLIHAVGISRDGREVYAIRHWGIHALSAKSLKKLRFWPISALTGHKKDVHVGGSLIEKGMLFVNADKRLFVLWTKR